MSDSCEVSQFFSPFCMRAARITGSSASGFDAQNLSKGRTPWKATGLTASLQVETPAPIAADTLIIAATNFSFGATITLTPQGGDPITIDASRRGPTPNDCFTTDEGSFEEAALINDIAQRGDGITTVFTVGGGAGLHVKELQIFIDGGRQIPTDDYTVSDSGFDLVVTFGAAPADGAKLHFYAASELRGGVGISCCETQLGDGSTVAFTITAPSGILASELEIFIDGLRQNPEGSTPDYTIAGSTVTFDEPPGIGAKVFFYADFDTAQAPGFGPRLLEGDEVGTGSQVAYEIASAAGVAQNALEIYVDGLRQQAGPDYRSTSLGSSLAITFTSPPPDGAKLLFYADSGINAAYGYDVQSEEWPRRNIVAKFPEVTASVWDIVISDPGNRDGQLSALRLILSTPRFAEHIQDGWTITPRHLYGKPFRTADGARVAPQAPVFRVLSIKTSLMSAENAYAEMRRDLALGLNQEIFIMPCPDDPALIETTSFLGVPVEIPQITSRGQFSRWSRPLVIEELF